MRHQQISQFLASRQAVISVLDELIAHRPFQGLNESVSENVNVLCESLVDYLSFGHFSFFELVAPLDRAQMGLLIENTQKALGFNDHYQGRFSITNLENDLSTLVQVLAKRFDWEDALINKYEGNQAEKAA